MHRVSKLEINGSNIIEAAVTAGIPEYLVKDITREKLTFWLTEDNLAKCIRLEVAGYILTRSIDIEPISGREVTLVEIIRDGIYEPHYHANSDAIFIIVDGNATLLSTDTEKQIQSGDIVSIPRGMLHGFKLQPQESLTWVSVQYPPIYSPDTGEDLHFPNHLRALV